VTLQAPQYLSPSSIGTFQQCPLRFKFSRIDKLPEPPTIHTMLGNFVHEILEDLYSFDSENRTLQVARSIARDKWDNKYSIETKQLNIDDHDFRWKAWWCVENLWKCEEPSTVNLDSVEYEINGSIEGVQIRGFVDRFQKDENGSIVVEDYKTGKVPNPRFTDDKFQQLFIYAVMLEALDIGTVSEIRLMYLVAPKILSRSVDDDARKKTIRTLVETKRLVDLFCEKEDFPAKPGPLCNWCTFKKICPAWKITK
jgi:putative RecB family exonuclease